MLGGDRRTWGTARLFQEIPSCLRTLRLGTRALGYSLGTADSVEGVRTREGGGLSGSCRPAGSSGARLCFLGLNSPLET